MSEKISKASKNTPENKQKLRSPADNDDAFHFSGAACATECTGLISRPPENEDGAESYRYIYDYGPPDPDDLPQSGNKR